MYIITLAINQTDLQPIAEIIKKNKHKTMEAILSKLTKNKSSEAKLTTEIKKADALVVEASESSFELGRFITLALQQHKPVLMLQKKNKSTPLLVGSSRLISMETYFPEKNQELKKIIESFFKTAKKQRLLYRFNFMMSSDMNDFLMTASQKSGVSKADYIRNLVIENMGE